MAGGALSNLENVKKMDSLRSTRAPTIAEIEATKKKKMEEIEKEVGDSVREKMKDFKDMIQLLGTNASKLQEMMGNMMRSMDGAVAAEQLNQAYDAIEAQSEHLLNYFENASVYMDLMDEKFVTMTARLRADRAYQENLVRFVLGGRVVEDDDGNSTMRWHGSRLLLQQNEFDRNYFDYFSNPEDYTLEQIENIFQKIKFTISSTRIYDALCRAADAYSLLHGTDFERLANFMQKNSGILQGDILSRMMSHF
jgi:hypothetical protein